MPSIEGPKDSVQRIKFKPEQKDKPGSLPASRLQQPLFFLFQHQAGQHTGGVGPGVDPDPVGSKLDLFGKTVSVHHDVVVLLGALSKILAYPQQVFIALFLEGDTRPDAGMDEQVVANLVH